MKNLESILLIDDDKICNLMNESMIHSLDKRIRVYTAHNGRKGMNFVTHHKHCPQLILLDLGMPDSDGFDFLDEFEKLPQEKRKDIPIVILTSSEYEKDMQHARQYTGVKGYVVKPLTPEKIVSILEEFLRDNIETKLS